MQNKLIFVGKSKPPPPHYYPQVLRCLYLAYERIYAVFYIRPNQNERGLSKIPVFVYNSQGGGGGLTFTHKS